MTALSSLLSDAPKKNTTNSYDLYAFCGVLYDHTIPVCDTLITKLGLTKGISSVGNKTEQQELLNNIEQLSSQTPSEVNCSLGGSCCNMARTMASLGAKVSFSTNVADDKEGRHIATTLKQQKNLHAHITWSSPHTGSTLVLVSEDGERTMHAQLGVSTKIDQHSFVSDDFLQSSLFHFCGYQWGVPSQKKVLRDALELAKLANIVVSFDLADPSVAHSFQKEFNELIASCHIVFGNESEVRALFGEGFVQKIHAQWPDTLFVIKRGADDVWLCKDQKITSIPVMQNISALDTTGAGDVFAAGFLSGLCRGLDFQASTHLGAVIAADVITRYGVKLSNSVIEWGQKFKG